MFKHILVPTDFGEPAQRALDLAISLAQTYGAKLTLLHTFDVPVLAYGDPLQWPIGRLEEAAKGALAELLAKTRARFRQCEGLVEMGPPWEHIVARADTREFDLIAMGTHGRRGIQRALIGSVAEKVVRLSPIPVLTVGTPVPAAIER